MSGGWHSSAESELYHFELGALTCASLPKLSLELLVATQRDRRRSQQWEAVTSRRTCYLHVYAGVIGEWHRPPFRMNFPIEAFAIPAIEQPRWP